MNAAIYCRVSTDQQERDGYSLDAQEDACRKRCKAEGWRVAKVVREVGSAKDAKRPKLQALLQQNSYHVFVVWDVSRLTRDVVDGLTIMAEMESRGVRVVDLNCPIETRTPHGEFVATIRLAEAQLRRKMISEQTKAAIARRWEEGQPLWVRKYGFRKNGDAWEMVPEEVALIRRIGKLYISGLGYARIAERLNQEKAQWRDGTRWARHRVEAIITDPIYGGDYAGRCRSGMGGEARTVQDLKGDLGPVFSREEWAAIQREREAKPRRHSEWADRHRYPLTGILRCHQCDVGLCGHQKRHQWRTQKRESVYLAYRCPECGRRGKLADIHQAIADTLQEYIDEGAGPIVLAPPTDLAEERERLESRLEALTGKAKRLRAAWVEGEYGDDLEEYRCTKEAIARERKEVKARLKLLEQDRPTAPPTVVQVSEVASAIVEALNSGEPEAVRAVVATHMRAIEVDFLERELAISLLAPQDESASGADGQL